MSREELIDVLNAMKRVLESPTNRAIIDNVIGELEDETATVALAISEVRTELRSSDADRDDPGISAALEVLRQAVRESQEDDE